MSSTCRTTIQLAILSILLIEISSLPHTLSPTARVKRYTYQGYNQRDYRFDASNNCTTNHKNNNEAKTEASRSIEENGRKNLVSRMSGIQTDNANIPSNNPREAGTLKILFGSNKPARESDTTYKLYFPDELEARRNNFTANPCPNDQSFCESIEEYPQEYVTGILKNSLNEFDDILGVDSLTTIEIGQRNDFSRTTVMCDSEEKVVFPKQALNKENKWMLVINTPNHEQGVRIEVCKSENVSCQFSDRFPRGYETTCKQKYIYRKMVALSNVGDAYVDLFRLPSCCSCSIRIPSEISSRFGFANNNNDTVLGTKHG